MGFHVSAWNYSIHDTDFAHSHGKQSPMRDACLNTVNGSISGARIAEKQRLRQRLVEPARIGLRFQFEHAMLGAQEVVATDAAKPSLVEEKPTIPVRCG